MKITGPGQIQSKAVKKSRAKQATATTAFKSEVGASGAASGGPAGVTGAGPIGPMDALLALQEAPDSTDGRSKGLMRADEMLDLLEDIRKGILLGAISTPSLRNLADLARNQKDNTGDPRLNQILEEIELRAEVELAKLGV